MDVVTLYGHYGRIDAESGGSRFESWQGRYIGGFHFIFTTISSGFDVSPSLPGATVVQLGGGLGSLSRPSALLHALADLE